MNIQQVLNGRFILSTCINTGLSKSYIYFVYNVWLLLSKVSGKYTKYCERKIKTVVDTVNLGSKMIRIRNVHNANPASVDEVQ